MLSAVFLIYTRLYGYGCAFSPGCAAAKFSRFGEFLNSRFSFLGLYFFLCPSHHFVLLADVGCYPRDTYSIFRKACALVCQLREKGSIAEPDFYSGPSKKGSEPAVAHGGCGSKSLHVRGQKCDWQRGRGGRFYVNDLRPTPLIEPPRTW